MTERPLLSPEQLLDAFPHSVALLDDAGVITRVNRAWAEAGRGAPRTSPGANYLRVCDESRGEGEEAARDVAAGLRGVLGGTEPKFRYEYACVIPGGGEHVFALEATSLGAASRERALVTHLDITLALGSQRVAQQHASMLGNLLQGINDVAIYMLDPLGNVRSWNAGAERLFGWNAAEIIGRATSRLYTDDAVEAGLPARVLSEARQQGVCADESWRVRKDGSRFIAAVTVYPITDPNAEVIGYAKVVRDATPQRQAEANLKQALTDLEKRNSELERFVYTVSHDLKTPLVTIAGFTGHIIADVRDGKSERVPSFAERVAAAADRMRATIDDLLGYCRVGRVEQPATSVPVREVAMRIVRDMEEQAANAGATIDVRCGSECVLADPSRVREAIEALVDNALKYGCPKPGMAVEIDACPHDGRVVIAVRDHGPGVPSESRDKIFGLFERLNSSRQGTGVGLAIVRRIAEMYGGRAWVESEPSQGATFFLSLPPAGGAGHSPIRPPQDAPP